MKTASLRFSGTPPKMFPSSPGILRGFCAQCGTSLSWQDVRAPEYIDLTIASMDHPELFPPSEEIWTEHRLAWDAERPGLVQQWQEAQE